MTIAEEEILYYTRKFRNNFFIIKDRIAVEVKTTKRVSPRDLKGLKALMEEGLMEKYILVCREDYPQLLDNGILILPYKDFLSDLWGGKIL